MQKHKNNTLLCLLYSSVTVISKLLRELTIDIKWHYYFLILPL